MSNKRALKMFTALHKEGHENCMSVLWLFFCSVYSALHLEAIFWCCLTGSYRCEKSWDQRECTNRRIMKSQRSLRVSEVWVALLQIAKQNKVRCKLPCSPPSTTNAICIFIIFMDNQPKCKDSQKKTFVSWVDSMTSNPHFFNCYYTTLHDRELAGA